MLWCGGWVAWGGGKLETLHIAKVSVWIIIDLYNLISPYSVIEIYPDFQYM